MTDRLQLFELEDMPWFPDSLRQFLTLYIVAFHRMLRTDRCIAPLLERAMRAAGINAIVDLCSGGGGPMLDVIRRLQTEHGLEVDLTFTDLYPNRMAAEGINSAGKGHVTYRLSPVDAGDVPEELRGVRSMMCSFHHMRPAVARRILEDAFKKRRALCVFELTDNSFPRALWWLPMPLAILNVLLLMPFVRPLSWRQILLTYVVPILPLMIAWDGVASNARTYTEADLRELTKDLNAPDYQWEIGKIRKTGYPSAMMYLLGLPKKQTSSVNHHE